MKIGAFIVGLLVIAGCSIDDYIYPPPEAAFFNLFIKNNTQAKVEIYLQGNTASQRFEQVGLLAVGEEIEIPELGVRHTYIVRAAFSGGSAQDYFYQQIILRDSPTNVFLSIE